MSEELILTVTLERPRLQGGGASSALSVLLDVRPNHAVLKGLLESTATRQATHLIVVIDVSGSMRWRLKRDDAESRRRIDIVVEATRSLLNRLGPADRLSLIRYDHASWTLTPPLGSEDREALTHALEKLREEGGGRTNMSTGLQVALNDATTKTALPTRILVLTDGSDDHPDRAIVLAREFMKRHTGFDAVGAGEYRHGFLLSLAQAAGGTAHRIACEQDAEAIFDQVLARGQDAIATNVELEAWITPEVAVGEVYRTRPDILYLGQVAPDTNNVLRLPIGQIARPERFQFLMAMEVPPRPADTRIRIAKVVLRYDIPALGIHQGEARVNAVVEMVSDASSAAERNGEVVHVARRARIQRQVIEIDRLTGRASSGAGFSSRVAT